ncbi:unnamed protein product, partial [marine sediment metagenome]
CRIYKQRLKDNWSSLEIDKKTHRCCISREKDKRIFKGCPYNFKQK